MTYILFWILFDFAYGTFLVEDNPNFDT